MIRGGSGASTGGMARMRAGLETAKNPERQTSICWWANGGGSVAFGGGATEVWVV